MKLRLCLPMLDCAGLCAAGSLSLPAFSDDGAMDDLLKVLRERGAISSFKYEELNNSCQDRRGTCKSGSFRIGKICRRG